MAKITKIEAKKSGLPKRLRVAAYARVSMETKRLLHSLSEQVSFYSSLIQKNPEWEYAGVYVDSGISGTGTDRRKEFKRLLDDCEKGKIDIILTKSISRFARNTLDLLETVRHLKTLGIDVRFEKEHINSLSADGELMLSILASFAQEESISISNNIKWAIRKKFEKGEPWNTGVFGYAWNGSKFIVNEEEAYAVRKIFDDFLNDVPLNATSKWLKENGYRASSRQFVNYVLQNSIYTGDLILQRYFVPNVFTHQSVKNKGELPMYLLENNHEPIIDSETFEKVQQKIRYNLEFNKEAHCIIKPKCFSKKIKCGCCGESYVCLPRRGKITDVGLVECWGCYGKVKSYGGEHSCKNGRIDGKELRRVYCEIMNTDEFDEFEFGQSVKQIIIDPDGSLHFHFYDGRTTEGKTVFHDPHKKKLYDIHPIIYGYKWTDGGYKISEPEAEGIRLIFEYYNNGTAASEISREMKRLGYKSFRGGFSRDMVMNILSNRFYLGERTYRAEISGTGKEETVIDDHEPIISMEDFKKANERREKIAKRYSNSRYYKQTNGGTDN